MESNKPATTNKPFFTVIMPTYNRAHSLPVAFASLQKQTFKSWELIIIDDGSTDDTKSVVQGLAKDDPRIRYYSQKNRGAAMARNLGITYAAGEFLAFLDSDDTLMSNHLQLRYNVFSNNKDIDLIYGPANIIGDPMVVDRNNPCALISLEDESVKMCGTFSVRRIGAIRAGGFPNVRYSEDGAFFDKAQKIGLKIFRLRLKTYNYDRTSNNSVCTMVIQQLSRKAVEVV